MRGKLFSLVQSRDEIPAEIVAAVISELTARRSFAPTFHFPTLLDMLRTQVTTVFLLIAALWAGISAATDPVPFGNERLNDFFFVKNGSVFHQFNHGAYGGTPRIVVQSQYEYVERMESSIREWMNGATGYRQCISAAKQRLAAMMNIKNASDTVLVDNASEGINAIIRNLDPPLGASDTILDLSVAYAPFKGLYQWLGSRYGVKTLEVPIQWPVTGPESFIEPIAAALKANASSSNIRVAIISHVSAYPAVILPVKQLVALFHQYNIPVIIDGAHALGNIEIDLADMSDVDYYFTNTHKWLYSSKSSAILYVRRDHQHLYVPAPAIVDSAMTDVFESRFIWTGTRDRTPYCAILSALDYRQSLGGEQRIMTYNEQLAQYGGRYLSRLWGTRVLSPENMQSGMTNVQVPTTNFTICQMVVNELYSTYKTMVSGASNVTPELGDIPCYLRLSAQIYQEKNDWHVLGALIAKLLKELNGYTPGSGALGL